MPPNNLFFRLIRQVSSDSYPKFLGLASLLFLGNKYMARGFNNIRLLDVKEYMLPSCQAKNKLDDDLQLSKGITQLTFFDWDYIGCRRVAKELHYYFEDFTSKYTPEDIKKILQDWGKHFADPKVALIAKLHLLLKLFTSSKKQEFFTTGLDEIYINTLRENVDNLCALPTIDSMVCMIAYTIIAYPEIRKKLPDDFIVRFALSGSNMRFILREIAKAEIHNGVDWCFSIIERLAAAKKITVEDLLCKDHDKAVLLNIYDWGFAEKIISKWPEILSCKNYNGENLVFWLRPDVLLMIYKKFKIDLNSLDNNGNSVLYGAPYKYKLLVAGAKYIRNHKEAKGNLHLQLEYADEDGLNFDSHALASINFQDEMGKTALHYAITLGKFKSAMELLDNGANPWLRDSAGRNALHYALFSGNLTIINKILEKTGLISEQELHAVDHFGVTNFAFACYSANSEVVSLVKERFAAHLTALDFVIIDLNNAWYNSPANIRSKIADFNSEQKTIILSALAALNTSYSMFSFAAMLHEVIHEQFRRPNTFRVGKAFGIELEFADLPFLLGMPYNLAYKAFDIIPTHDETAQSSILMSFPMRNHYYQTLSDNELVSPIITNNTELELFLKFVEAAKLAGARVNKTNGFHVHVNMRGVYGKRLAPITTQLAQNRQENNYGLYHYYQTWTDKSKNEQEERQLLLVVKQIIRNFARIEPLLCGFLRNGKLYYNEEFTYTGSIEELLDKFEAAQSIEELIDVPESRYCNINVKSLASYGNHAHGTLEFRMHEGSVDPIIIRAWLNLINRLVDISVDQVANNDSIPFRDIELLVYILIAEREYNKTWNNAWGAPLNAFIDGADTDIQVKIQNSTLYRMFLLAKQGKDFADCAGFKVLSKAEQEQLLQDLEAMIKLCNQYPGVSDVPIDMLNFTRNMNHARGGGRRSIELCVE